MSFLSKFMAQGGHPSGFIGSILGRMMNRHHRDIYRWALEGISPGQHSSALDIGCGGGQAVRMLADILRGGKVCGVDHSQEMVDLSRRVNRTAVKEGRVEIQPGSVSSLPYGNDTFDLVTAFETIQFWPALKSDLMEVWRVLKPSGRFLVANRYPDLQGRDTAYAELLQIHSADEYRHLLEGAGFADINIDTGSRPGWIKATARKS